MKVINSILFVFMATASFGQDSLTQTLSGDTIGSVLVNCSSDFDTHLFELRGTDTVRIERITDSLYLIENDTTFIGLPTQEDRIALTWESDTIRVSLNGADAISKGVNYSQDYTEWFISTQSPVSYYELIRWAIRLTNHEIQTLTE
jgi:hypothetical protein